MAHDRRRRVRATCRRIARESGSSFYAGMRLLPPDRRDALFADLRARAPDRRHRRRRRSPPDEKLAALERDRATSSARIDETRRSGARRRRRRGAPLPDPARRVRRPRRRRRDGRARHRVRDLRRPRALLPLRRGLDRPARARRLRLLRPRARRRRSPTTSASRSSSANILRDLSEDLAQRPRLPAARGPRALRLQRRATGASTGPVELLVAFEAQRALEPARRAASTLVPLLDRRSAVVRARDGRQVPAGCSSGSRPTRRSSCAAGCRCAAGRRGSCSRGALVAERGVNGARVAVVGGGLAGLAAALDCADARRDA